MGPMPLVRVCAITCDCYPEDPLVRRTAEAAADAGCDYHVICSMREGQQKYELFNGVHVHRILLRGLDGKPVGRITARPIGTMLVLWSMFGLLAFAKAARLHLTLRFDVVHVHNLPDFLVFAALVPKMLGAKVILHIQDVSPELMVTKTKGLWRRVTFPLARWQERLSAAFADYVLTAGWPFAESLVKRGVPRAKLSTILNSADPKLFPAEKRTRPFLGAATAERPIILMYHGTCAPRFGLDTAICAFAKARTAAPYLRLHIMGGGEALPDLKQLAQRVGITEQVVFFPPGPADTVVDFVAQGDIGIIPYTSNGFMDLALPTKAYEFALMRRPIIASNTPAIRSLFRSCSIMLCEPSNPDSFAEAILDLYWHPRRRAELIANAEQDNMKYGWETMAERYRQVLASLATRGSYKNEVRGLSGELRG